MHDIRVGVKSCCIIIYLIKYGKNLSLDVIDSVVEIFVTKTPYVFPLSYRLQGREFITY